ncbi:serpin family protein [Flindersiella endophytica]
MRRRELLTAGGLAALLAACGGEPAPGPHDQPSGKAKAEMLTASGVTRERPQASAAVEPVVDGLSAFGHALIGTLDSRTRNVVVSPLSIAYAFGMVRAGALGQTAAQIDRVFGFPKQGLHPALNAITQDAVTVDGPPPRTAAGAKRSPDKPPSPPIVAVANGLFVRASFEVRQEFLRVLAAQYGAGVRTVDFSTDQAAEVVNAWAAKQTADRIKQVFEQLDPDTALVLANAVYLKADWQAPFESGLTRDEAFTKADGSKANVPMMHNATLRAAFAEGEGWQAVELPYAGGELAMRVIVPASVSALPDLLAPASLAAVGSALRPGLVDFAMPKFDFATDVQLVPSLQRLGMTVPFDADAADFNGIGVRENLYITQAVHKANITVDEWGTEAAAVTAIGMRTTAMPVVDTRIRADRAFAFSIVHKPTGAQLFVGQVADPSV